MPYARNVLFKGRDSSLREIREAFDTATVQAPCVSVYGLGGVGKTQLAIEYAYRYRDSYSGILWLECADNVETRYAALARELEIQLPSSLTLEARVAAVREELEGDRKYLLILDNVDEATVEELRPKMGATHILITTRIHLVHVIQIFLDVMSVQEALEVLQSMDGMEERVSQMELLEGIANELGRLPLALAAARQLLSNGHHPGRLLEKVKQDVGRTIEKLPMDYTFRKSSSLSDLFGTSLDQLNEECAQDGELARAIFFVGGFFSPDAIPLPLLSTAAQYYLGKEPDSEEDGEMAAMNLVRLSLAIRDKDGFIMFHRVVQTYAASKADQKRARSSVLKTLVRTNCISKTVPHFQRLWDAYAEVRRRGECLQDEEPLLAEVAHSLGYYDACQNTTNNVKCFSLLDQILARGPDRIGRPYYDITVSKLFWLTRKKKTHDHARALVTKASQAKGCVKDATFARQAILLYDWMLNWRAGDRAMERELYDMGEVMLKNARTLEERPLPPSAGAWGPYYFKGAEYWTVGMALEVLGWMFTTLVPDPRFALALYTVTDDILSEQYTAWGPGSVGHLYVRLEREARLSRLVWLAFSLPCGAPPHVLQATLARELTGIVPAYGQTQQERAQKEALMKRNIAKITNWMAAGLGNVRSTLVLALQLGELGLVTGGPSGKALIRKGTALLEKELLAIERSCGNDSNEVATTLYRLASLYTYLGYRNGLRQARQIIETRMRVEVDQQLVHRETRFHLLLAQVYLEQGLLEPAKEQLHLTCRVTPTSDTGRTGKVLELLAAVSWLQGNGREAMAYIDQAAAVMKGQRPAAFNSMGMDDIRQIIQQWEEKHPGRVS